MQEEEAAAVVLPLHVKEEMEQTLSCLVLLHQNQIFKFVQVVLVEINQPTLVVAVVAARCRLPPRVEPEV